MADSRTKVEAGTLVHRLKYTLETIHGNPPAEVDHPVRKRASVALILRVRPDAPRRTAPLVDTEASSSPFDTRLDDFFSQEWVREGQPEMLFIKRATRVGDRWTGHVACPGGKREPGDADDQAAAARESQEEIGLDLDANCLLIGSLPERVITTNWGKIP